MERELPPVFDDIGREVDRDKYWGQKQLGEAIGATAVQVGVLLRELGFLEPDTKEPSAAALQDGAGIMVTLRETAGGPQRYPRWNKDLVRARSSIEFT